MAIPVYSSQGNKLDAIEFRFAFHARYFEKSLGFYQTTLGMKYIGGWDREDGKGALLSAGGNAVIEIYGAAAGKSYEGPSPVAINLALRLKDVSEVDSFYQQLTSEGIAGEPPQDQHWGHRSFVIYDPDGIPIHIYCEI